MKTRMRWDCDTMGCFLKKKVCRLEDFDDCFGGKIGLTDVDGLVERKGCFLFTEWKAPFEKLPMGQQILFEQLTKLSDRILVVVINGHSSMEKGSKPESYYVIYKGKQQAEIKTNVQHLSAFFKRWYVWADNQEEFDGTRE